MGRFEIAGKRVIGGVHKVPGNKNAALPMIAAALLTSEPVTLENMPDIADVSCMLECAARFGARIVRKAGSDSITIHAQNLRSARLDPALAAQIRASILFAGPLLARKGRVSLPPPGGDGIGHRRLDAHFCGFAALGAKVKYAKSRLLLKADRATGPRLRGAEIILDEASVTATENIVMAAALAEGDTVIYNAACEPHVQDLCAMLNGMGARILGAGTNRIVVHGVERLHGTTARVGADLIEAVSYLVAAAITGGGLTLKDVDVPQFGFLAAPLRRFGLKWTADAASGTIELPARQRLSMRYDFGDAIPCVSDGPWPMFPSDLMSILIVLATQTRGTCLFHEKMFESRLYFVDHLIQMGAKIVLCDPHRVVVTGPSLLRGTTVTSPDIRAGIALILAALCAKGKTVILNAESVDRGYGAVEETLGGLGADIRRM